MKILDNFILGKSGRLFPDRRTAAREFRELAAQFDFSLDPDAYVDTLTVGERQQLEILRLLWFGARVLILDEPTTGISQPQKEKLFATLKRLAAQGMTIIFVSHKLEDVEFLCSRVAVLRQGELVGHRRSALRDEIPGAHDVHAGTSPFTGKTAQAAGQADPVPRAASPWRRSACRSGT